MLVQNYLYNLNQVQSSLGNSEEVLTTGKQLNHPSDNPLAIAQDMNLSTELSQNQVYQSTINQAENRLTATSTTLSGMSSSLQSVKNLVLQALNSPTQSQTSYAALDQNLVQLVNSLDQQVNAQQDGVYLFGGFATNQAVSPYVSTSQLNTNVSAASLTTPVVAQGGTLNLIGSSGSASISVSAGATVQDLLNGINQVSGQTGIVASTVPVAGGVQLVLAPQQAGSAFGVYSQSVVLSTGATFAATTSTVSAAPSGSAQNIQFNVAPSVQETVNVTGDALFNSTPAGSTSSLQGTLQSILNDVANPTALNADLKNLSANMNQLTETQTSVGARSAQLNSLQAQMTSAGQNEQNQQATLENANMAQVYSAYEAQLTAYQAALKIGPQMMLPTLAQYV